MAAMQGAREEPAGSGELDAEDARRVAEALVRRHAAAPRAPEGAPDAAAHRRALRRAVAALAPHAEGLGVAAALAEVEAQQARFVAERADLLLERAGDGRTLGRAVALELGDVAWGADAAEVRLAPGAAARTGTGAAPTGDDGAEDEAGPGDVAVELAGLSVAMLARGRGGPAERLLSHYAGEADDFDLYGVIDFHERAVALERAARGAGALEAGGGDADGDAAAAAVRTHVELARATTRPGRLALTPVVVAMGGAVASGKSTLARALADRLALPRVVADRVRDHLLRGSGPHGSRRPHGETAGMGGGGARGVHEVDWVQAFAPGFQARVYAELLRRAAAVVGSGRAVVLDACFPRPREREAARALAQRHGLGFVWVECRVDGDTWRARLAERDAASPDGGWGEIAARLQDSRVGPDEDELRAGEHVIVDTGRPLEESLEALRTRLRV